MTQHTTYSITPILPMVHVHLPKQIPSKPDASLPDPLAFDVLSVYLQPFQA